MSSTNQFTFGVFLGFALILLVYDSAERGSIWTPMN